jgi:hypothetical protein
MASFNPRIFTSPDRLKSISATHLLAFLSKWKEYFASRGVSLPDEANEDFPYDTIAQVLMKPDDHVPDQMVDALYYIHETATKETAEELLEIAQHAGLTLEAGEEPTNADIAVQIWLQRSDLLQRKHAEVVAFNRSRFTYFAGRTGKKRPAIEPTPAQTAAMQELKRRGKGCRIFAFPRGSKTWFLVRHGEPMRREGRHQDDGESGIAYYRPQKHDVVIYDGETDELAVNAGTKGERELYLKTFGALLFGDEEYFDRSDRFTLDPLIEKGPEALQNETVPEIGEVRLVEIERFWGGKAKEKEVRKASDLFLAWGDQWDKRIAGGSIDRAVFKVKFSGDGKERTVAILPRSLARYDRDGDADLIDLWLKDQGFCRLNPDDGDDDDSFLEDD